MKSSTLWIIFVPLSEWIRFFLVRFLTPLTATNSFWSIFTSQTSWVSTWLCCALHRRPQANKSDMKTHLFHTNRAHRWQDTKTTVAHCALWIHRMGASYHLSTSAIVSSRHALQSSSPSSFLVLQLLKRRRQTLCVCIRAVCRAWPICKMMPVKYVVQQQARNKNNLKQAIRRLCSNLMHAAVTEQSLHMRVFCAQAERNRNVIYYTLCSPFHAFVQSNRFFSPLLPLFTLNFSSFALRASFPHRHTHTHTRAHTCTHKYAIYILSRRYTSHKCLAMFVCAYATQNVSVFLCPSITFFLLPLLLDLNVVHLPVCLWFVCSCAYPQPARQFETQFCRFMLR